MTPIRVEGSYAVFQGTAEVQGSAFSVGGSTFSVQYGKIGVGTSTPSALLHISSAAGVGGDLVLISTGASNVIRMTGAGEIYANKFYGDVSGASGLPSVSGGDSLGTHIATQTLNMGTFNIVSAGSITANAAITTYSSITVAGNAFSVGGSTLAVAAGRVGIGTAYPGFLLDIAPPSALNRRLGMGGAQVLYLPDQTNFTGTLVIGNGGGSLTHSLGSDGMYNTFVGLNNATAHTTGNMNTFVGYNAGYSTLDGYYNSFVGTGAGYSNTSGHSNVFLGTNSGYFNDSGWTNTAVGNVAGYRNVTGTRNVLLGFSAGYGVAGNSYSNNTILGYYSGSGVTTGSNNILLGYQAGDALTSGADNIVIGYDVDTSAPGASNELNIGGVLYGSLSAKTIGISTRAPQAALDVVSTGTASNIYAQLWRNGSGVIVASMTSQGALYATLPNVTGDNLGNHTATKTLSMAGFSVINASSINYMSNVYLTSGTQAQYGGLYLSSHVYLADGSNIYNASTIAAAGDITAARYQIGGGTVLTLLPGSGLALGISAGRVDNSNYNTYVGYQAGYANATTGSYNTFLGYQAGKTNSTGGNNTFVGRDAGSATTIGSNNTFVGAQTAVDNVTGEANTYMGYNAGRYSQTGSANVALGYYAGTGSAGNSFSSTTLVGYQAGRNLAAGSADNTFLGWQAGFNVTTGTGNIVIGYNENTSAQTASNELNIGEVLFGNLDARTIGISTRVPQAALDIVSTGTAINQYAQIWRNSAGTIVSSMTATGVLYPRPTTPAGDNLGDHTATTQLKMGNYAIWSSSDITAARYQINGSTVLAVLPGNGSMAVGPNAGMVSTGPNNLFVGVDAGYSTTVGDGNSFVGYSAGYNNTGQSNSFIGYYAGYANTTGGGNVFLGVAAGRTNTTGVYNAYLGNYTAYNNGAGSGNVILGHEAGYGGGGTFSSSTLMGYHAGYGLTTGSENILLGWQAGDAIAGGARNIIIGYNQDASAATASNELNIGGVLYGDLSAKTIGISTRVPQAALDIVSTGTAISQYAQIWRNSAGTIVSSMTATGVLYPQSAPPAGDNLGNHTATTHLDMAGKAVFNASSMTITGAGITGTDSVFTVAGSTLNILANGNVGIGAANPTNKLEVASTGGSTLQFDTSVAGIVTLKIGGVAVAEMLP